MGFWWRVGMVIDDIAMKLDNSIYAAKDVGDGLIDLAKSTKEDIGEFNDLIKEAAVDLTQTAVEDVLDYTSEKIDRYFENWEVILSDDPYIDGKKEGYERAAFKFEELYKKQDLENQELLRIVKMNAIQQDFKIMYIKELINKKKKELDILKKKKQENIENASKVSGYTIEEIQGFVINTKCSNLFDLISNKKLKEKKKGELNGFNEAKALFKKRLNKMKEEYNRAIDALILNDEEELELYEEICSEVYKVNAEMLAVDMFIK